MSKKNGYELSYQATQNKGRRQAPATRTKSEDVVLRPSERRKMLATARDQSRNMSVAGWMLRRHLDYVSSFDPLVKTGNDDLNAWLKRAIDRHGKRRNFDAAGRHSRKAMMRLFEGLKTLDGDAAFLKVDGYKLQGIEGDRIAKPSDLPRELADVVGEHGLALDPVTGATSKYCICKRDDVGGTSLEYGDLKDASDVVFDGYFNRWDQTRGISPLASIINQTADLYEAMEWTQLKIKLHALMGIQINRETTSEAADGLATTESLDYDTDAAGVQTAENSYEMSMNGLSVFDMEPGESVSTVESATPSEEFQHWTDRTMRQVLLALDIPYSALAGESSNFSARIADREEYEKSSQGKRQRNVDALEEIYDWVIRGWYKDNPTFRRLVDKAGLAIDDVVDSVQWISSGTPWLDKLKEVSGDALAVYNGFETRQDVCKRHNKDFYDVIDKLAEEQEYAEKRGVVLVMGQPGQATLEDLEVTPTEAKEADNG